MAEKLMSWKSSPATEEGFLRLEKLPSCWGRIPGAGKAPQQLGTDSRSWKGSPAAGDGFQVLEMFPSCWGTFPGK